MKTMRRADAWAPWLGVRLLIPVLLFVGRWFQISASSSPSHADVITAFEAPLPAWLRGRLTTTLSAAALAGLATAVSFCGTRQAARAGRVLAWIVCGLAALLFDWLVFSLM